MTAKTKPDVPAPMRGLEWCSRHGEWVEPKHHDHARCPCRFDQFRKPEFTRGPWNAGGKVKLRDAYGETHEFHHVLAEGRGVALICIPNLDRTGAESRANANLVLAAPALYEAAWAAYDDAQDVDGQVGITSVARLRAALDRAVPRQVA